VPPTTQVHETHHWIESRSTLGRVVLPSLPELIRYRELALVLALRDIQVRYKQTFFGVAWAIVQPLAAVGAFTFVFNGLAGLEGGGLPYPVFALAGLLAWGYFASGAGRAGWALVDNEEIVTKVYFPRLLLSMAAVLPGLVDFGIGLLVLAALMIGYGVAPSAALLALPVLVAALALFTFGFGSLVSALNVRYRDIGNGLPFLLQIWLFVSPVAYSSSLADGDLRILYYLNPMAGFIDAFRWSLVGQPAPGPEALLSAAVAAVLIVVGVLVFGRTERRFADVI
jgi:lipopolysaccharide transport system permease protein